MHEPIEISLTTFIDFVFASGTPKITCVRKAKEQYGEPYEPQKDFWRVLRNGIVEMHQRNAKATTLDGLLLDLRDPKKRRLYPDCIDGYKRWLGRKTATWTNATSVHWQFDDLIVSVNPELGLTLNGRPHRIKLYFKQEQLTKRRVQTILHLLRTTVPNEPDTTLGILDVPRAKLIPLDSPASGIDALLQGEARSFTTMWKAL
jgi:hypothetical protein